MRLHKHAINVALFATVLLVAGGALAYWVAPGTGVGSVRTPAPQPVTLSPGSPASTLIPGRQADVVLTASNPNAYALHINSFVLDTSQGLGGFAVDAAHAGCNVSALSFTTDTHEGAGWTLPAKVGSTNGKLSVVLTNALAMGLGAASACQGALTTVFLQAGS